MKEKQGAPSTPKKSICSNPALILTLSFLLPVLILLLVYRNFGIYPFGDKSLLIMDLNGQSVDFYAYVRGILCEGNSLFYSFQKGLGGNVVGLLGYYGDFPTTFLIAFFPKRNMTEAILLLNLLKVGLAGLTMCIFLHSFTKKWSLDEAALSVAYGVCTYAVIYSMQFQWLWGLILLPLVALGVNRMVESGKWGIFVLFYTLLLLGNSYTGFMVTLFIVLYFLWYLIAYREAVPAKKGKKIPSSQKAAWVWNKILLFALSGIGSFAFSAVWTVPSFMATLSGRSDMVPFRPEGNITYNIGNIYQKLFIGQYDSITNTVKETAGTPSVFSSMLVILFVVFYFVSKKIPLREKLASGGMLLIFSLSVALVPLDQIWHVFSYPNWFPCRWAFVMVFFGVMLSGRFLATKEAGEESLRLWIAMGGAFLVLLFLYANHQTDFRYPRLAAFSLALLLLYALLAFATGKMPQTASAVLLATVSLEVALAGAGTMEGLNSQFGYKDRAAYVSAIEKTNGAVDAIRAMDPTPFYRVEKTYLRSDNDAMNAGYMGLTHYSSSFDKSFNDLDKALGMVQEWYACRYQGATPVIDAAFGIKYLISDFAPSDTYRECADGIYENPNAFPLGFLAEGDLAAPSYGSSYFENQNAFFKGLTGKTPFTAADAETADSLAYRVTVTEESPLYLSVPNKVGGGIYVVTKEGEITPRDTQETKMKLLGTFPVGESVEVILPSAEAAEFAYLSEDAVAAAATWARDNGMTVTQLKGTKIKGSVHTSQGGTLLTTVPYDKGWQVTVDGKAAETKEAMGEFLSFPVKEGESEVVLTYRTPGLRGGVALTLLAFLALIGYGVMKKRKTSVTAKTL